MQEAFRANEAARTFERFTERARKVFARAQEEAHRLRHPYLGTEHILLGLVDDVDSVAGQVLSLLGAEPAKVRDAMESVIGPGEDETRREMGLTRRAKKVMQLAVAESKRLEHDYVGTEHLLLGLLDEGEGVAAKVLRNLGIELNAARRTVQELLVKQDGR